MLEARDVVALGEGGSGRNIGLRNDMCAVATLRGGSFTGRGGIDAYGIYNFEDNTTLEAEGVSALGKDGSSTNYGLYNNSATANVTHGVLEGASNGLYQILGTVRLGVSQLDGGATRPSGTLTCFQVYDGNYAAYSCP
jgi:hypothetical protein